VKPYKYWGFQRFKSVLPPRPRQSNHESGWIFLFYSDKSKDLGAIKRKKGIRRSLDWIVLSNNPIFRITAKVILPPRPRQSNHESGWIFLFYSDKSKDLGAIKRKKGIRRSLDWIVLSNNPIFRITAKVILPPR